MHKPFCLLLSLNITYLFFIGDCLAQPVDTLITELTELARFDEAVALDIDPSGILYVIDQGTHSIQQMDRHGVLMHQFGGPGEGEGQFDAPADIDVTNGLVLVVADAGNGRIQRFSREFLFLESLLVDDVDTGNKDAFGSEPAYRQREQVLSGFGSGRPIALITSPDNEMYAIDEVSNTVVKWDKNRNIEQYIGAYNQGAGSLIEPASIALGEDGAVYVADRGHEAVFVYDAFGGFDRTLAEGLCADVQAVYIDENKLFIVLRDKLLLYQTRGLLEYTMGFEISESLVDVAMFKDKLYLLTERRLYVMGI